MIHLKILFSGIMVLMAVGIFCAIAFLLGTSLFYYPWYTVPVVLLIIAYILGCVAEEG